MPSLKQEYGEMTSANKVDTSNFLQYLDSHFVPEIDLKEDTKKTQMSIEADTEAKAKNPFSCHHSTKDSSCETQEVNLKYKGQKNSYTKGTFAERVDVLYKTLIRSIRRYLWDLFCQDHNPKEINDRAKASSVFKQKLTEFSTKYFQDYLQSNDPEQTEIFLENLATFMTNKFWIPDNSFRIRKFRTLLNVNLKQYSSYKYKQFFKLEGCVTFFKILSAAGFLDKIIEAYPKLNQSQESYQKIISEILNTL